MREAAKKVEATVERVADAIESKAEEAKDWFAEHATPEPFRRGDGPKVDVFNEAKNWASEKAFEALRPDGPAAKLKGPQRVAYGPLNSPPALKRPLVMIPGLTMPAKSFDTMANRLAEKKSNGPVVVYVASEKTFRLGDQQGRKVTAAELKSARLFQVEFKDPWASPSVKAPQIDAAMKRIAAATGQKTVDVVAHSAGATDFRLYLDQRNPTSGPTVNQVALIGPASHGTYLGNMGAVAGGVLKNVDDAARELAVGSSMVNELNKTWERQRSQVAGGVTIIGISGAPTLGPKKGVFEDGDGYMPTAQLPMPGARTVIHEGPHNTPLAHLWEVQYSGVVNDVFDMLAR